jgi:nucleoside-diphosphate-sugar epimerase
MKTSLVIGSSGFVGQALARELVARGQCHVRLAQRSAVSAARGATLTQLPQHYSALADTTLDALFDDVETVYHLAAITPQVLSKLAPAERVAALKDTAHMPLWFAKAAQLRGCKRFVLLSTCGIYGDRTMGKPISENSPRNEHDDYTRAKASSENQLQENSNTVPDLTIIRTPMVYGSGLKGPMRHLLRLTASGVPLPFGQLTENRRSMIGVNNLADALIHAAHHPDAAGQAFVVADNEQLSTQQFLASAAAAAGKSNRLLPIPRSLLIFAARAVGIGDLFDRVFGDYVIDDTAVRQRLNWSAPHSTSAELSRLFLENRPADAR